MPFQVDYQAGDTYPEQGPPDNILWVYSDLTLIVSCLLNKGGLRRFPVGLGRCSVINSADMGTLGNSPPL